MGLPGFTAEFSLQRSTTHHRSPANRLRSPVGSGVVPQIGWHGETMQATCWCVFWVDPTGYLQRSCTCIGELLGRG